MKKLVYYLSVFCMGISVLSCSDDKEDDKDDKEDITLENVIEIKTDFGDIYMWLYDETPLHKSNFLALADSGYFNGTTFHRVINNFVIQGGDPNTKDNDPNNDGSGGPGYTIEAEIDSSLLVHSYGAVGAARLRDSENPERKSSGSQFYIVENPGGTHFLDGDYTVFGFIVSGMDVVEMIADQPTSGTDKPLSDIIMDIEIVESWEMDKNLFDSLAFSNN